MKDNEEEKENLIIDNKKIEEENKNEQSPKKEEKKETDEQYINLEVNNSNYSNNLTDKLLLNDDTNRSFENIIEDDIKRNDTAEFMFKKKKLEDDIDEYKYEDEYNDIIKKSSKTKFVIHYKLNRNFLRYLTLVTIIIYTIITIVSCIFFHKRRDEHPFLFCFKFFYNMSEKEELIYFLTDINSFYILHLVLLIIFVSICYLLIKGTKSEIDYFFKNVSIYFTLTLIFNIPILITGMLTETFYGSHLQSGIYLGLSLLSFLCMAKIYFVTKSHKYKNITTLTNINILTSVMSAYQCYCFLFNVNYFILNFYKPVTGGSEYPGIEIAFNSIYSVIGIIVIIVYHDIFFCVVMLNMEIGLLYIKRISKYALEITIVNVAIISLNYASIISVIFRFNKKVFMLKENKN